MMFAKPCKMSTTYAILGMPSAWVRGNQHHVHVVTPWKGKDFPTQR